MYVICQLDVLLIRLYYTHFVIVIFVSRRTVRPSKNILLSLNDLRW